MEREEASSKYKWDLTDIYLSQEDWDKDFNDLVSKVDKFLEYKGKFNDKEALEDYNKFDEEFSRKFMKLYIYSYLGHDVSLKDTRFETNLAKIAALQSKLAQVTSYISPEMASLDNSYLQELIKDERFKDYKKTYEGIIKNKKHVLSEEQEAALATTSDYSDGFSEIYDTLMDTDLTFDSFVVDNKEYKMSNEKYSAYLTNSNREIREKAYNSLYKSYKNFAHTFAKIFIYHLKMCSSDLKLRKYESYLTGALEGSNIPLTVYNKLIDKVNENVDVMKEYFHLLKKETGIEDFSFFDSYVSISSLDKTYDYETQTKIVKEALSVLGEEYQELLQRAYDEHWIDVYPSDTKSSGGYQYGCYDTHPYVFLNNTDNYNSMSTLAHELGHAMHSYYSKKYQPYPTSNYAIYVAEVASTVNEILLNRYMIENSNSVEDKIYFIDQYIKQIKGTVFRQTMFSEFEQKMHELVENQTPMNLEEINKVYYEVLNKHFEGAIKIDENINHEWIRISHFYRPFYVYKYATSYTCANYIATCILENKNNMKEKYFELLKSGGKDWPDTLLKNVGVDLSSDAPYDTLFNDLKNSIKDLEKLLKEAKKDKVLKRG